MKKVSLVFLFLILAFTQLYSQCVTPQVVIGAGQTPTSVYIQCNGNGASTLLFYVEYGLSGFTPGTGASAGVGGTIFTTTSTTTQTITGLIPNSEYDFYIRQTCTGGVFSANATVKRTVTPPDCATAPVISCGAMQSVSFPATNYWGVWAGCSTNDWLGREKNLSFYTNFYWNACIICTTTCITYQ
ncbi:MAG: hypothetical protein IPJ79_09410 [Bacteroidetes bacterium]|nr:hypothetical protein [Bacteroidota bacterium]